MGLFKKKNDSDGLDFDSAGLTTADIIDEFSEKPLPDAIDELLFRVSMDDEGVLSGFERYAARLFTEAAADRIRPLTAEFSLEYRWLSATGLFWAIYPADEMDAAQIAAVLDVEAALNRIVLTARHFESEKGEPAILSTITEEACSVADWEVIRSIADVAPSVFANGAEDNPLLEVCGVSGRRGGNWDIMTRVASECEEMVLPFRMEYRVGSDAPAGLVAISLTLPPANRFPKSRWDGSRWVDCSGEAADFAAAYYVRLAMLAASAAFGSSVGVTRVVVKASEAFDSSDAPLLLEFSRMAFLGRTLRAIEAGYASEEGSEAALDAILDIARPVYWGSAAAPGTEGEAEVDPKVAELTACLDHVRIPVAEDKRAIPADLQGPLCADEVFELNVFDDSQKALLEEISCIRSEGEESPLLAIAQLEEILSASDQAERDMDGKRGLFCTSSFARYVVSIPEPDTAKRYFMFSEGAFNSRYNLSRLYMAVGDADAAIAQAKKCLELAPSSFPIYMNLIYMYAEVDDYTRVIDVAKRALSICLEYPDAQYAYYRIAFAFWQSGQHNEALAAYAFAASGGPVAEQAAIEMRDLMAEMGVNEPPEHTEAAACLRAASVPIALTDAVRELVAKAAIGLCDAGIPLASAPIAEILARGENDDALRAVAQSMHRGVF